MTSEGAGPVKVSCLVYLRAEGVGTGWAKWHGMSYRVFADKYRSTTFSEGSVDANDLRSSWGDSTIVAKTPQRALWEFSASVPFAVAMDFRYRTSDGKEKVSSIDFDCRPSVTGNSGAPVLSLVSIEPATAELEPGGTLRVRYGASSPWGIWKSSVSLSGPCAMVVEFQERLELILTRTVNIRIPGDCRLGVPIKVSVFVQDGGLEAVVRDSMTTISLVDRTRPSVGVQLDSKDGQGTISNLEQTYFTGDTLDLRISANDNQQLRGVYWELRPVGVRDSLLVTTTSVDQLIRIPIETTWHGALQLVVYSRDMSGLVSDTVLSAPNALRVFPTVDANVAWADFADAATMALIDNARNAVYLLQPFQSRVAVFSLTSMRIGETVTLPSMPGEFDLSAGGDSLLFTLPILRALAIVDLRSPPLRAVILRLAALDALPDMQPLNVRATSRGTALVTAGGQSGPFRLLDVDLATGVSRLRNEMGLSGLLRSPSMYRSPDHTAVTIQRADCIVRYDALTDRFGNCAPEDTPQVMSLSRDGARLASSLNVFDESWQRVQRLDLVTTGTFGVETLLRPSGTDAYYQFGGDFVHVAVNDGQIRDRIRLPRGGYQFYMSPDGRFVVALGGTVIGVIQLP